MKRRFLRSSSPSLFSVRNIGHNLLYHETMEIKKQQEVLMMNMFLAVMLALSFAYTVLDLVDRIEGKKKAF